MIVKQIDIYLQTEYETLLELLISKNFISENGSYYIKYLSTILTITEHKFKKENKLNYLITFKNEEDYHLNIKEYEKLSNKFFTTLLKDVEYKISESNFLLHSPLLPEVIIKKMMKKRFRKPVENLDTVNFSDLKKHNELLLAFQRNFGSTYEYQMFVNTKSGLDIKMLNSYLKRVLQICNM